MADMASKGRHSAGNRKGAKNHNARLSPEDVCLIRKKAKAASQRQVAKEFGVTQQTVSDLVTGRRWAHLSCS